jgi:hypothetical protein
MAFRQRGVLPGNDPDRRGDMRRKLAKLKQRKDMSTHRDRAMKHFAMNLNPMRWLTRDDARDVQSLLYNSSDEHALVLSIADVAEYIGCNRRNLSQAVVQKLEHALRCPRCPNYITLLDLEEADRRHPTFCALDRLEDESSEDE